MNSIILTGGTSKRFGSDKFKALINGFSLLEIAARDLEDLIIVGPESPIKAIYVQEEPPLGGPVAAIASAIGLVKSELVGIFAVDMPFATRIISELSKGLINDAALPLDREGIAQPLSGIYRVESLKKALSDLGSSKGTSMKSLINKLVIDEVEISDPRFLIDIDTPLDLVEAIDFHSKLLS